MAARVRTYRLRRNWSARELAERCQAAGLKWNREIVSNLERGKRNIVSIDELLILAYVLGVPPVMMFIPLGDAPAVRITPDVVTDTWSATKWVRGEDIDPRNLTKFDRFTLDPEHRQMWSSTHGNLLLYEEFEEASADLRDANWYFVEAGVSPGSWDSSTADAIRRRDELVEQELLASATNTELDDDAKKELTRISGYLAGREKRGVALRRLAVSLEQILGSGLQLPFVSTDTVDQLRDAGLLERPHLKRWLNAGPKESEDG